MSCWDDIFYWVRRTKDGRKGKCQQIKQRKGKIFLEVFWEDGKRTWIAYSKIDKVDWIK